MTYPNVSMKTVEEVIAGREGDTVLQRRSGGPVYCRYNAGCQANSLHHGKIWSLFGKAE